MSLGGERYLAIVACAFLLFIGTLFRDMLVPKGAEHTYRILDTFTAVEATAPPAQVHGRDEA